MRETILECVSVGFLGLGFFLCERPILSILCFALFAVLGCICVYFEDEKERKMFRK